MFRSSDPFSQCILPCYILPSWCHLHHTRIGWIREIPSYPIQHFLEPSTSSCKVASSLFKHHLYINAARELVETQLMRRQQLFKDIFLSFLFYPWPHVPPLVVMQFQSMFVTIRRSGRPWTHIAEKDFVLGRILDASHVISTPLFIWIPL